MAVYAALAMGCSDKRQRRSGDAPPVEIVAAPTFGDAGAGSGVAALEEREPNDGADVATPLALGGVVRGRLEPDGDTDYYRIDAAGGGALSIMLSAVSGADLVLEVEDASGTVIARSDRGPAGTVEGAPNLGVMPGRYTAVVRRKPPPPARRSPRRRGGPPPAEPSPAAPAVYELSAAVPAIAAGAEREPDDDRGTANDLIPGEPAVGYIGWTSDVDLWKLSLEAVAAKSVLDVEVGPLDGAALIVELADGIGQPLLGRRGPRGGKLAIKGWLPAVAPGAPPFHYLTVRADRSNPEATYALAVTARVPGVDAEYEPNDSVARPMAIPDERTVVREAAWTPGDVDCFAIPRDPAPRSLAISITTPSEADLRLELYLDGKSIATADRKGRGVAEEVTGAVPADSLAVACVRGAEGSQEGTYDLAIRDAPAPP